MIDRLIVSEQIEAKISYYGKGMMQRKKQKTHARHNNKEASSTSYLRAIRNDENSKSIKTQMTMSKQQQRNKRNRQQTNEKYCATDSLCCPALL